GAAKVVGGAAGTTEATGGRAAGPPRVTGWLPVMWFGLVTAGWAVLSMASAWFAGLAAPLAFVWLLALPLWAGMFGMTLLTCLFIVAVTRHAGELSGLLVFGPLAGAVVVTLAALRLPPSGDAGDARSRDRAPGATAGSRPGFAPGSGPGAARLERTAEPSTPTAWPERAGSSESGGWPERAGWKRVARRPARREGVARQRPAEVTALRRSSLVEAVRRLSDETAARTSIPVRFGVAGTPVELPPTHDVALLRVARGALGNIGRHSGASHARVRLTYLDDLIMLDVFDDGRGFDPYTTVGHELRAMRQRVEALGGTLSVGSAPGGGTAVVAGLPK
uniref:sensor histidine kinase n=1 Tax=Nonomuraea lactucae TaxID=2249762 RepID=UPI0030844A8C